MSAPVYTNPKTPSGSDWVKTLFGNGGKTLEKLGLYIVGSLTAANVIDPANLRPWILVTVGAILTGLHISTPTPKSGPGQL